MYHITFNLYLNLVVTILICCFTSFFSVKEVWGKSYCCHAVIVLLKTMVSLLIDIFSPIKATMVVGDLLWMIYYLLQNELLLVRHLKPQSIAYPYKDIKFTFCIRRVCDYRWQTDTVQLASSQETNCNKVNKYTEISSFPISGENIS